MITMDFSLLILVSLGFVHTSSMRISIARLTLLF